MTSDNAVKASELGLAWRVKEDGYLIFMNHDSSLWTETASGKVKRFGGNYGIHNDWEPLHEDTEPFKIWTTKIGRGDQLPIAERWEEAVALSPINMAYRLKQSDGAMMVRLPDGVTYSEIGQSFHMTKGTFKAYDGWKAYTADDKHAQLFIQLKGKRPDTIRKNYGVVLPIDPNAPPKQPIKSSPVAPETLIAAGQLGQALSKVFEIQVNTAGKLPKEAQETLDILKRLAKNTSWLMFEGREDWKEKQ